MKRTKKQQADKAATAPTQAQALVALAQDVTLFHDGETPYAGILFDDHRRTYALRSREFRNWLARRYYNAHRSAANAQAMQDCIDTLAGGALFEGREHRVHVRLAEHAGDVYLDLCDERWQAVRIGPNGWRLTDDPPVRFIRRRGQQELPAPVRGGSLAELRPLINAPADDTGEDAAWVLLCSWLVMSLHPRGPYPVAAVNGEQGSAKSTTCRMVRRLIDPNDADLRSAPKDERDLMIAATNSWLVAFDNLSHLPPALSDSLCRLATGGGFATRELYTDGDEKLFSATRPVLLNGIDELATRPDLLERAVTVTLPPIPDTQRRDEAELWGAYEQARPRILGALCDAVSMALRRFGTVRMDEMPRMADFAKWVTAAEPALPWDAGTFASVYGNNREAAVEAAVESAAIGPAIDGLMHDNNRWTGTARELLVEINTERRSDSQTRSRTDWPKTPKGVANALRRLAPALRRRQLHVTFDRTGHDRTRTITIERGEKPQSAQSAQSATPVFEGGNGDIAPLLRTVADDRGRSNGKHSPHETLGNFRPADHADCADCQIPIQSEDDEFDRLERAAVAGEDM